MFKKIEVWILYLVIFAGIFITILFGSLVKSELVGNKKGWLSKSALFLAEIPGNIRELLNPESPIFTDVRHKNLNRGFNVYAEPDLRGPKYLLLSRWDTDINQAIVELIDIHRFKVLHRWNPDITNFLKGFDSNNQLLKELKFKSPENLFEIFSPVLANEILYFHGNRTPILGLDAESNIVKVFDDYYHHSLELTKDNYLWTTNVSCPVNNQLIQEKECNDHVRDENIIKLDLEGKVVYEKNITDLLYENNINVYRNNDNNVDITHVNDVQPIHFSSKYWDDNDVFISLRSLDLALLYDTMENKIQWTSSFLSGLKNQHDINVLSEKEITIFNNNIKYSMKDGKRSRIVDEYSTMIVYNFETNEYTSLLDKYFKEYEIKTATSGKGEVSLNGDILIEETNYGRLIYLDSNGKKLWEFYNLGKNGLAGTVTWHNLITEDFEIKHIERFLKKRRNL